MMHLVDNAGINFIFSYTPCAQCYSHPNGLRQRLVPQLSFLLPLTFLLEMIGIIFYLPSFQWGEESPSTILLRICYSGFVPKE